VPRCPIAGDANGQLQHMDANDARVETAGMEQETGRGQMIIMGVKTHWGMWCVQAEEAYVHRLTPEIIKNVGGKHYAHIDQHELHVHCLEVPSVMSEVPAAINTVTVRLANIYVLDEVDEEEDPAAGPTAPPAAVTAPLVRFRILSYRYTM